MQCPCDYCDWSYLTPGHCLVNKLLTSFPGWSVVDVLDIDTLPFDSTAQKFNKISGNIIETTQLNYKVDLTS